MWPRIVEVMLGCWLAMSPFILGYPADATFLWWNDFIVAALIISISLVAIRRSTEKMHFANLVLVGYLIAVAFIHSGSPPAEAWFQNYVIVALLLLMMAILPTRSLLPPAAWQRFYEERKARS